MGFGQDFAKARGFAGGHHSVKRDLRKLRLKRPAGNGADTRIDGRTKRPLAVMFRTDTECEPLISMVALEPMLPTKGRDRRLGHSTRVRMHCRGKEKLGGCRIRDEHSLAAL